MGFLINDLKCDNFLRHQVNDYSTQPIAVKKFKLPGDQYYRSRRLTIIKKEASIQKELSMYQKFPQYYGWVLLDEDTISDRHRRNS